MGGGGYIEEETVEEEIIIEFQFYLPRGRKVLEVLLEENEVNQTPITISGQQIISTGTKDI